MREPTTDWGKKLLERSWWDAGMRGHFTRLSNTTGPEDMAYAIVGIEEEARAKALADVYGYTNDVLDRLAAEMQSIAAGPALMVGIDEVLAAIERARRPGAHG